MKKIGFNSYKVVNKATNNIVGFIDFKIDDDVYLSLLMIHDRYRGMCIGQEVYTLFESYIKSLNCNCIKIDVVKNYDDTVFRFWEKNKFLKICDITLNWGKSHLPATVMKKRL